MAGERSSQPTETALVQAIAGGSHEALAALYDRHADVVYATASRLTSDRQVAAKSDNMSLIAGMSHMREIRDPNSARGEPAQKDRVSKCNWEWLD